MAIILVRKIDANGRNWPGVAIVNPAAPFPAAVLAQELWEADHKLNPWNLLRTRLDKAARRDMELMGHECEVQTAALIYGRDKDQYRRAEAEALLRGYDGLFSGSTPAKIAADMAQRSPKASAWVRDNLDLLRRYETL